ncbi:MAG: hypothetical protein AAGG38_13930 [Planctomycetota bacterium]
MDAPTVEDRYQQFLGTTNDPQAASMLVLAEAMRGLEYQVNSIAQNLNDVAYGGRIDVRLEQTEPIEVKTNP